MKRFLAITFCLLAFLAPEFIAGADTIGTRNNSDEYWFMANTAGRTSFRDPDRFFVLYDDKSMELRANGTFDVAGAMNVTGSINSITAIVDYGTTATARAITVAESGTDFVLHTFVGVTTGTVTFTLPAAVVGLEYTFIDNDATAGNDLEIQAGAGDTINGGTAAKAYVCTGDAVKQACKVVAVDGTAWLIVHEVGTWANDNS